MNKILWSDFHSNMHSGHLKDIEEWYKFAKEMLDFWAPVYYPYFINHNERGFSFEDTLCEDRWGEDWEKLRSFMNSKKDDFILYMGYEWQGNGQDGDHNIIFQNHEGKICLPLNYQELYETLHDQQVIAIPHHTGYECGHRGKNWETNQETFSPVSEIYSSHGSSECSDSPIPLNVHIHMGPRSEKGTYLNALKEGIHVGVIASGDNHVCPAISGNGLFGVISEDYTREAIFKAIQERRTYGVTRNKIQLDYTINEKLMGSIIEYQECNCLKLHAIAGNAIDRIEIYRNGAIEKIIPHSGTWEKRKLEDKVRFKFEIELGWGPDRRVFKDLSKKIWEISLETKGKIVGYEVLWTSPGSFIQEVSEHKISASILTKKEIKGDGKLSQKNYLTPNIQNQSLIFEIEDELKNDLTLTIDGKVHQIAIFSILNEAKLIAQETEIQEMIKEQFAFGNYYREDAWWHHAYKVLIHKGVVKDGYDVQIKYDIKELEKEEDNFMVKVIQKNADCAWSSPIWIKGGK